jgi:plasmid maintenance system antidote protein VapI
MPKPSRYPKHPVRVLRKLLGFNTATAFASFVGIPAETIRNCEQGRCKVSQDVARRIGVATGLSPIGWLRSGNTAKGKPMSYENEELTPEVFNRYRGLTFGMKSDPNEEEWADDVDDMCQAVAALLRGAIRKGRFPQCKYSLMIYLREAEDAFGLKAVERTPEIDKRLSPQDDDWPAFYRAYRLLSPTHRFRWESELAERRTCDSSDVLYEIDGARDAVERSFSIKRRQSKRSSGRDARVSAK